MNTEMRMDKAVLPQLLSRLCICTLLFFSLIGSKAAARHWMGTPDAMIPDTIMVAKDGSGDFTEIQKAIEAAKSYPLNRIVIYIKKGVYTEKVRIAAWNPDLSLIGEDRDSTIIQFGDYFGSINKGRNSTFYTSTLSIEAAGVICRHLTIENTAGPVGQAIALSVLGDQCLIEDCKILGHQDTFFATGPHTHVYLNRCQISGTTDFIFGDATVLLKNCLIYCKADSYIVAASTPKDQPFGIVLDGCTIEAAAGVNRVYLGRPWRPYAKTVYLHTRMGDFITAVGWDNWRNKANESTAYYGEYQSIDMGSKKNPDMAKRASWSHQLNKKEANRYTTERILGSWVTNYL